MWSTFSWVKRISIIRSGLSFNFTKKSKRSVPPRCFGGTDRNSGRGSAELTERVLLPPARSNILVNMSWVPNSSWSSGKARRDSVSSTEADSSQRLIASEINKCRDENSGFETFWSEPLCRTELTLHAEPTDGGVWAQLQAKVEAQSQHHGENKCAFSNFQSDFLIPFKRSFGFHSKHISDFNPRDEEFWYLYKHEELVN